MRARSVAMVGALAVGGLLLAGCGDEEAPAGGQPSASISASTSASTPATPSPAPTAATSKPTVQPTPTKKPASISEAMLLRGADVAKADPGRGWVAGGGRETPYCGPHSVAGAGVVKTLKRGFNNGLDASGGQWLTVYKDDAAAKAAYDSIVKTIKTCPAGKPAGTHARKLTENRTIAAGDATSILRWYDYPLPSDPGSEDGGFPHAVTRTGSVVSVTVFGEMGKGVKPANFEKLARVAAGRLG